MSRRDKRPQAKNQAGYPSLSEHLLSRRDLITYLGASLLTGSALAGCFIGGDDDAGGGYYSMRLPEQGTDLATLADGGGCWYFVNVVAYCDYSYHDLFDSAAEALAVCRARLAQLDYVTLSAVKSGENTEPFRQVEQQLVEDLRDEINCESYGYDDFTVTLTLVELMA